MPEYPLYGGPLDGERCSLPPGAREWLIEEAALLSTSAREYDGASIESVRRRYLVAQSRATGRWLLVWEPLLPHLEGEARIAG